jgi:hypothetical protein
MPSLADYLRDQLAGSEEWSKALANIPGLDPSSPAAQALVSQMAGLGQYSGPAFIDAFGQASYAELAAQLGGAQNAASGTGKLWADYFYGAGVTSAQEMVTAMADQLEKDEKKLRKIGKRTGDKIGEGIAQGIRDAVSSALAAAQAASGAGGASASTRAAPVNVTVQAGTVLDPVAAARTINRILSEGALRTPRGA